MVPRALQFVARIQSAGKNERAAQDKEENKQANYNMNSHLGHQAHNVPLCEEDHSVRILP